MADSQSKESLWERMKEWLRRWREKIEAVGVGTA